MATTSPRRAPARGGRPSNVTSIAKRAAAGPDRFTVWVLSLAAVLAVLAVLAWQLRAAPAPRTRPVVLVRKIYETRTIETVVGAPGGDTQSVSSSASASALPAPAATRAS